MSSVETIVLGAIVLFCAFMVSINTFGLWFWPIGFSADKYYAFINKAHLNREDVTKRCNLVELFIHDRYCRIGLGRVKLWVTDEDGNIQTFNGELRTDTRYGFIRLQWVGE